MVRPDEADRRDPEGGEADASCCTVPAGESPTLSGTPPGGVISPPLSNIYLGVLDKLWERRHAHLGELVRYCDDVVILCRNTTACEEAEGKVREILRRVYFLQPRPSPRSMQRVRQRVKETLGRNRNVVKDVRVIIRDVSRVRGIRMHGLNGGTVLSPASQGKG